VSAKVGDTIVVINSRLGDWFNKEFIVHALIKTMPEWIYIRGDNFSGLSALCPSDYKMIKHSLATSRSSLSSCSYCKGTGKIKLLTSTVDCECVL
jgi:hypothetical protein